MVGGGEGRGLRVTLLLSNNEYKLKELIKATFVLIETVYELVDNVAYIFSHHYVNYSQPQIASHRRATSG